MLKLLKHLESRREFWFLFITSVVFFLLRLPSFFEPYWYGDEGIYEVVGFALHKGRALYTGIWDNKPPFLYLLYALFNGNQPIVRIASCVVGILSVIVFYFLAKRLFEKANTSKLATYVATGLFAFLFATPLIEGNIANAENFMLLPIFLAGFLVLRFLKENKSNSIRVLLIPGLLLGIAFLFKVVAVFDFAAFFFFLFITRFKTLGKIKNQIPELCMLTVGFFFPLFVTLLYFLVTGHIGTFIQSAFLSNVGYVGYGNKLFFPQGLLVFKLILLSLFVLFLFKKRHVLSENYLFTLLWLAFSLFNALFSQRAYIHYALVLLGSISLAIGLIVLQKRKRIYFIGAIGIVTVALIIYFSLIPGIKKSLFGYYGNYLSFTLGKESVTNYIGFFDQASLKDYALAEFFKSILRPEDTIFLWGNNGQLYRLIGTLPPGRYIVEYHILASGKTLQETSDVLEKTLPRYIVIMPNQSPYPFSLAKYKPRFTVDSVVIYEKII